MTSSRLAPDQSSFQLFREPILGKMPDEYSSLLRIVGPEDGLTWDTQYSNCIIMILQCFLLRVPALLSYSKS